MNRISSEVAAAIAVGFFGFAANAPAQTALRDADITRGLTEALKAPPAHFSRRC